MHNENDVGMGLDDFLSLGGHLLVPFLFHEVTSLHSPSFQRNYFSTCTLCMARCVYCMFWTRAIKSSNKISFLNTTYMQIILTVLLLLRDKDKSHSILNTFNLKSTKNPLLRTSNINHTLILLL